MLFMSNSSFFIIVDTGQLSALRIGSTWIYILYILFLYLLLFKLVCTFILVHYSVSTDLKVFHPKISDIFFQQEPCVVPAVVDLPTPPFPEATTRTCLTPAMGFCLGRPLAMCCLCLSCSAWLSTDLWEKHDTSKITRQWARCGLTVGFDWNKK